MASLWAERAPGSWSPNVLEQGSANYSPGTKSSPLPVSVNKRSRLHSHAHSRTHHPWLLLSYKSKTETIRSAESILLATWSFTESTCRVLSCSPYNVGRIHLSLEHLFTSTPRQGLKFYRGEEGKRPCLGGPMRTGAEEEGGAPSEDETGESCKG